MSVASGGDEVEEQWTETVKAGALTTPADLQPS